MELKGQRPGRFAPRCPQCSQKFVLVVPEGDRSPRAFVAENGVQAAAVGSTAPATTAPAVTEPVMVSVGPAPQAVGEAPRQAGAISRRLGGYEILRKLGEGGMGSVYLARQLSLDRNVAVKVLRPGLSQDPAFIARFTREAYAAAQLSHHNIVQIHDIGQNESVHFFSMEFVEGQTLAALVQQSGHVEAETAVALVLQAARGLKFAHDRAMVHRDVKPENLLIDDAGLVKVADLGLVKRRGSSDVAAAPSALSAAADASRTAANLSMGTPAYMAPEQARDAAAADARADIYSLGCTLYALLTGRPPFVGASAAEVIAKHAREPVTPPGVLVKACPARSRRSS